MAVDRPGYCWFLLLTCTEDVVAGNRLRMNKSETIYVGLEFVATDLAMSSG
jgi:hypothetical protein